MALIKLDYDLAVAQANKLESAGGRCAEVASAVNTHIETIRANWSGKSADALIEQLTAWVKDVNAMNNTLISLAGKVRSKANAIKAADESGTKKA